MLPNTTTRASDSRGQANPRMIVGLIVGLTVAAIITAFLLPIGVGALNDGSMETHNQTEDEAVVITGPLNSTVLEVDDTAETVEVELNDTETGASDSATIDLDATETLTVEGEDIDVTVDSINSATTATLTYDYPTTYAWGDGASALWGIIDMIIVLGVFLALIGVALAATGRL